MTIAKPAVLPPLAAALLFACGAPQADPLPLASGGAAATVLADGDKAVRVAAGILRRDIEAVTGHAGKLITRLDDCGEVCLVL